MRMPYQRMTRGPIWKATAPGELNIGARIACWCWWNDSDPHGAVARHCLAQGGVHVLRTVASEDAVEPGDVRTARDRDDDAVRPPRTHADQSARPGEQPKDVLRVVRERVGGIVSTRRNAPMSAAVRLDASADKFGRMLLHDAPLPRLQNDRPQVLPTGTVLREEDRPRVRVGVHDHDDATPAISHWVAGTKRSDHLGDSLDDPFLALVERDVEAVRPACPANVAVAQVHPE